MTRPVHIVLGRARALTAAETAAEVAIRDSIDTGRIMADVRDLTVTRRVAGTAGYDRGEAIFLAKADGMPGWRVRVEKSVSPDGPVHNIIMEHPGTLPDGKRGVVIGGAHLDATQGTVGANDNGVAAVGLLEAARALWDIQTPHDIRLMAFDREEPGLVGARGWIKAQRRQEIDRTIGMLNMEMIGSPNQTSAAYSMGRRAPDEFGEEIDRVAARNGIALRRWDERSRRSDHQVFSQRRIPSAMFGTRLGETVEETRTLDPNYHLPSDVADNLNQPVLTDHVRAFTLTLHDLAQGPALPKNGHPWLWAGGAAAGAAGGAGAIAWATSGD